MENVNLTIRIPPDLLDQLRARAKQEDRTLASLIRVLLAQAVRPAQPPLEDWGPIGAGTDMPTRMAGETDEAWKQRADAAVKAWAESRQR